MVKGCSVSGAGGFGCFLWFREVPVTGGSVSGGFYWVSRSFYTVSMLM